MLFHFIARLFDPGTIAGTDVNCILRIRMDGHIDETMHDIILDKFKNKKSYKEQKVKEIIAAVCAMLNSNGGKVAIVTTSGNDTPVGGSLFSQMSLVIRILEQSMISIIGLHRTTSNINFIQDNESMLILVKKAYFLITTSYNLYLPSQSQVVLVSPLEPFEQIKNDIINRKAILEPVQLGSHNRIFRRDTICGIHESKTVQFKHLEAHATKRTTLADRIIGKGNKFTCYVSAFANYNGSHIYLGITASGVVVGEVIQNEEDKTEIKKKVEKAIKKMIWPEQIGEPKLGQHWNILFEIVLDEHNKPIPSTFVIVIYIGPHLGGVFTEEPECYEMVKEQVKKMSLTTWKKRMLVPDCSEKEIPRSIPRITWSSPEARQSFTVGGEKLRILISNGDWCAFLKECEDLRKKPQSFEMSLLILSKQITASYRRGQFKKAHDLLEEYEKILPKAKDGMIFEVMKLFLEAALKRASGDLKGLIEPLKSALSMAELIEPGLVPAIVYVFAATVTDLVDSGDLAKKFSPDSLSRRALEHLRWVPDSSDVRADMEQRAHMTLVTFHLGCNVSGQRIKDSIHISDLDKAKDSITALYQCFAEASPLTRYREVQHNLVLSIYKYRCSQLNPDEKVRYLRQAFSYAEKGERLASDLGFKEMVEWGRANKAFCAEALIGISSRNKKTVCTTPKI